MIIMYTTPTCSKCKVLKKECENRGVTVTCVDITEDSKAHALLLSMGLHSVPQVSQDGKFLEGDFNSIRKQLVG